MSEYSAMINYSLRLYSIFKYTEYLVVVEFVYYFTSIPNFFMTFSIFLSQAELKGRCKAVHIVLEKISNVLVADKSVGAEKAHPPVPPPPPKISEPTKKLVEMVK